MSGSRESKNSIEAMKKAEKASNDVYFNHRRELSVLRFKKSVEGIEDYLLGPEDRLITRQTHPLSCTVVAASALIARQTNAKSKTQLANKLKEVLIENSKTHRDSEGETPFSFNREAMWLYRGHYNHYRNGRIEIPKNYQKCDSQPCTVDHLICTSRDSNFPKVNAHVQSIADIVKSKGTAIVDLRVAHSRYSHAYALIGFQQGAFILEDSKGIHRKTPEELIRLLSTGSAGYAIFDESQGIEWIIPVGLRLELAETSKKNGNTNP